MNVLSLFDGISCGHLALDKAGIRIDNYYSSEIDKNAIKITTKNYPNTIHLGDVKKINFEELPKIDLLIGGSPCQGFSRNGNMLNFDDPRSKLFFNFVEAIEKLKPKYFLLENVVMKKEWESVMTNYLGVDPILIDSHLVSAQKRQRLYWTNIPNVTQPEDKKITLISILEKSVPSVFFNLSDDENNMIKYRDGFVEVKQATKKEYDEAYFGDSINFSVPKSYTRRGRVGKQKTNTIDTSCNYGVYLPEGIRKLTLSEYERCQNLPDDYTLGASNNQRKKMIGNGWTVDVVAHIFRNIKNVRGNSCT